MYAFKRAIIIDPSKCGSADSSNFAFYYPGHADLATVTNGGLSQNANGFDLAFFADPGLSVPLPYERVSRSASNGLGEYHVKIPLLSSSQYTRVYRAFGDASIGTDQSNGPGVWDSNYLGVYHFGDGATLSLADSTSNANNLTNNGATSTAGVVGGAASYNGSNQSMSVAIDLSGTTVVTLEFSMYKPSFANDDQIAFEYTTNFNNNDGLIVDPNSSEGGFDVFVSGSNSTGYNGGRFTRPSAAAWHDYMLSFWRAGSSALGQSAFLDGVSASITQSQSGSISGNFANSTLYIMSRANSSLFCAAKLDELRLSKILRSASWAAATSANKSSPATFYTEGPLEAITSPLFWLGD